MNCTTAQLQQFHMERYDRECLDAAQERQSAITSEVSQCGRAHSNIWKHWRSSRRGSLTGFKSFVKTEYCGMTLYSACPLHKSLCAMQCLADNEGISSLTMQAVMLYLTMSATLCALCTVTTVLFIPGAATRGAVAAPTVRFRSMAVDRESSRSKSLICTSVDCSEIKSLHHLGGC